MNNIASNQAYTMQIVIPPHSTVAIFPFLKVMTRGIVIVSKRAVLAADETGDRAPLARCGMVRPEQSQEETDQFFQYRGIFKEKGSCFSR